MSETATAAADPNDRWFFGHPKSLAFLAFTEAWERFSYYGMISLLTLYMTKQLLLPGHVDHIAGFEAARTFFTHTYGGGQAMTIVALASAIYGFYASTVYVTPFLVGGPLGDWVLGRTGTIILGACLMAMGHFLMAFDVSFLGALACLMLGSGCLKGNLAAQVGGLYGETDNRRADAFQIYYLGINGGVILGPLVTGWLSLRFGWHFGFGAAGIGMLVALVIYLVGRKHLPPELPRGAAARAASRSRAQPMTGRDWRVLILLILLLPVLALSIVGNNQIQNAYLVWADKSVDLHLFGLPVPTPTLVSVDAIFSVATIALMVWFWREWGKRFREPDELGKIVIGCLFGAAGVACLALGAELTPPGAKVSFLWLCAFHLLNDIGFANVLPVGLAFYARAAPKPAAGAIVGVYYLHLWAGNTLVGWLGGKLDKMPADQFWWLHAGLVGSAGVVFLFVWLIFGRMLRHEPVGLDEETVVAADAGETP